MSSDDDIENRNPSENERRVKRICLGQGGSSSIFEINKLQFRLKCVLDDKKQLQEEKDEEIKNLKREKDEILERQHYLALKEENAEKSCQHYMSRWEEERDAHSTYRESAEKKILSLQEQIRDLASRKSIDLATMEHNHMELLQKRADKSEALAASYQSKIHELTAELEAIRKASPEPKEAVPNVEALKSGKEQRTAGHSDTERILRQQVRDLEKLGKRLKLKLEEKTIACRKSELLAIELSDMKKKNDAIDMDSQETQRLRREYEDMICEQDRWRQELRSLLLRDGSKDVSPFDVISLLRKKNVENAALSQRVAELEGRLSHVSERLRVEQRKLVAERSNSHQLAESLASTEEMLQIEKGAHNIHLREIEEMKAMLDEFIADGDRDPKNLAKSVTKSKKKSVADMNKFRKSIEKSGIAEATEILRGRVSELEAQLAAATAERDEAQCRADSLESKAAKLEFRSVQGDFNAEATKVLHMKRNPHQIALSKREAQRYEKQIEELKLQNEELNKKIRVLRSGAGNQAALDSSVLSTTSTVKGVDTDKRYERLKQLFAQRSRLFRDAIYSILGFKVDLRSDHEFPIVEMKSMYGASEDEAIIFRWVNGTPELLQNEFTASLEKKIFTYLQTCHSIPGFMASIILEQFEQRTFQGG